MLVIYGVYDMSGGTLEYVMGVIKDNSSDNPMSGNATTYNSGFTGKLYESGKYISLTGRNWPELKYFDLYEFGTTDQDVSAYARSKLGDATTETKGWYGEHAYFARDYAPWFVRGGYYNNVDSGVFAFSISGGQASINYGFRPVLVEQ